MQEALAVRTVTGEIVDPNDAWERHRRIIGLKQTIERTFLELAEELYEFKRLEQYKILGHETFESYLADPDVNIGRSTTFKLLSIHHTFRVELISPAAGLVDTGIDKLGIIAPYVNQENVEDWLDRAATLSRSDLRMAVHYSSDRLDWGTPWLFFRELDYEFGFTLDVCATEETAKCERFFSPEDDGLSQEWTGVCWMNPPYGDEIAGWIKKAYRESRKGALVVCLVPSRTDTAWWHDYVMKAKEIRFVRGRLRFEGATTSAPFPSAVVVFERGFEGVPTISACMALND